MADLPITSFVIEHFYMSLVGFATGIIPGFALAFAITKVRERIIPKALSVQYLFIFFPWRSITLGLLVIIHFPFYLMMNVGVGPKMGIVGTSIYIFLFSFFLAETRFESATKPFDKRRVLDLARSLAVFSVLLAYNFGVWAAGGLGLIISKAVQLFLFEMVWKSFAFLFVIGFLFDELFALAEFVLFKKSSIPEEIGQQAP